VLDRRYTLFLGDMIRESSYIAVTIPCIIPIRWFRENKHDKLPLLVIVIKKVNHCFFEESFREILYILSDLHYSKNTGLFGVAI
jgi:hypothetical protein